MKIEKIKVNNFRSLKNFSIDLEDELSLIVEKNKNILDLLQIEDYNNYE